MALRVLNDPTAAVSPAGAAAQAMLDAGDFDVLVAGYNQTGILNTGSGTPGKVTLQAGMTLNVAACTVIIQGVQTTLAAGSVTLAGADATNPRIDLVVATAAGFAVVSGVAAGVGPGLDYPALTFDGAGNASQAVLAAVYVPSAAGAIIAGNITDKRVMLNPAFSTYVTRVAKRMTFQ